MTAHIPEDVARFKPEKCCRIIKDASAYRVYKYQAVKLPSGKWGNGKSYLIGKIIPGEGFIPNKRHQRELDEKKKDEFHDETTDVSYGDYALLMSLSSDILSRLTECFPKDRALQIYAYALILCANGFVHVDQVPEFFQESVLSLLYEKYDIHMGYTALAALLRDLGKKGNPVREFEQGLIDSSSKNIAVDGHVIRCCSEENDLGEAGYKMNLLKSPQVNLLIAYDTKTNLPLLYRTYRGSSVDKKSVEEQLVSRRFKDVKFLVDRGFFSGKVLEMMSANGNCYIIPVPSNNKKFKEIKDRLTYSDGEFVYRSGKKDCARIIYQEERIDDKTRIIVYKDVDENNSKRKSYKMMMDAGEDGYTQEGYDQYCEWCGVYALQTTAADPVPVIFSDYKGRWAIETFNNYIKNDGSFNDLKIQDYYSQHGFDFIMLVTGLIHAKLNEAVRSLNKPSISTVDILIKAGHMRMVKGESDWHLHNTRLKDTELLELLGFRPEKTLQVNKK